jgi:choline transport protein
MTMVIGTVTSFLWTIAFMFSSNDLEEVSASYLPILAVFYQALDSKGGSAFLAVWLLFVYYGASISCFLTAGRLTWAFARDNGLPFSRFFAKVHPTLQVPVNASLLTMVFCAAYGAIYIGSTTAFNSFISLSILGLNITYAIPQGIVLFRGRDKVLPARQFDLGPILGPFSNAFSVLWTLFITILFCFPVFLPATVENMNYVSVVLVGVAVLTLCVWWGGKRKTFTGPAIRIDGLEMLNELNKATTRAGAEGGVISSKEAEAEAEAAH